MYTLNTQLTCFKYTFESRKLIVNINWFRLGGDSHAYTFSRIELDAVIRFIRRNIVNFPGAYFIEESKAQRLNYPPAAEVSKTLLPQYLILSKKTDNTWDKEIYSIERIVLTDRNYDTLLPYDLNFDIIGKIEIYRQVKELF
jgi:hypothetical protein